MGKFHREPLMQERRGKIGTVRRPFVQSLGRVYLHPPKSMSDQVRGSSFRLVLGPSSPQVSRLRQGGCGKLRSVKDDSSPAPPTSQRQRCAQTPILLIPPQAQSPHHQELPRICTRIRWTPMHVGSFRNLVEQALENLR